MLLTVLARATGGEIEDAQNLFFSGDYARVVDVASNGVAERSYSEEWQTLLSESLLALGTDPSRVAGLQSVATELEAVLAVH